MSDNALKLSIVIPAYNEEGHIDACLKSIQAQTVMPDEVIVVDNNSTDKTAEIAQTYPFVTLIHEKKQGLRPTRDKGVFKASGEIIGRIDADSQMTPDWCAIVINEFTQKPDIDALCGPCVYYDMPLEKIGLALDRAIRKTLYSTDDTPVLFGSNMVFRRSIWNKVHPDLCEHGEFFEDYDMTIHLREVDAKIHFSEDLIMGVSARRLDDSPRDFFTNMGLHTKTFEMHGQRSNVATYGRFIYLSSYPTLKVIRKLYDPKTKKLSLKKAFYSKTQSRPEGANS